MDNNETLAQLLADLFAIDAGSVNDQTSPDTIEKWDSLGMVSLIGELENVFKIEFSLMEIPMLRSVGLIKEILAEKGVAF